MKMFLLADLCKANHGQYDFYKNCNWRLQLQNYNDGQYYTDIFRSTIDIFRYVIVAKREVEIEVDLSNKVS